MKITNFSIIQLNNSPKRQSNPISFNGKPQNAFNNSDGEKRLKADDQKILEIVNANINRDSLQFNNKFKTYPIDFDFFKIFPKIPEELLKKSELLKQSDSTGITKSVNIDNKKTTVKTKEKDIDFSQELFEDIKLPKRVHKPRSFEASDKNLILDKYQKQAIDAFREGKTVIVTAPTGTGKTLIAEYAIDDAIKSGKKIIYLAPLKALSNEKYNKFGELFGTYNELGELVGKENIGIITGDVKINTDAPVIVMTTEVYRNMVASHTKSELEEELKDVDGVIFDEFHYLDDEDRGTVWEEAIMFSPPNIKFMMLSATASNAEQIKNWISSVNPAKDVELVNIPESERHVPLKYFAYAALKKDTKPQLLNLMKMSVNVDKLENGQISSRVKEALINIGKAYAPKTSELSDEELVKQGIESIKINFNDIAGEKGLIDSELFKQKLIQEGFKEEQAEQISLTLSDSDSRIMNPVLIKASNKSKLPIISLIRTLNEQNKLPALFFIFSKKGCKKALMKATSAIGPLTTPQERAEIKQIIDECKEKDIFLGKDFEELYEPALLKGYAVHHAGMLPSYKSLVENLFRNKLLKVAFATETMIAGINMPVKTVVMTSMNKMTSSGKKQITSSLMKQGSGRAGRRGIDELGYVVCLAETSDSLSTAFKLLTTPKTEINSHLKMSYNLLLSPGMINDTEKTLKRSFTYYQTNNSDEMLKKASNMKNLMIERGFIKQDDDNNLVITEKGNIASQVRGINEIFLAEFLANEEITKDIKPHELAGLISNFMDKPAGNHVSTNNFEINRVLANQILGYDEVVRVISPQDLVIILSKLEKILANDEYSKNITPNTLTKLVSNLNVALSMQDKSNKVKYPEFHTLAERLSDKKITDNLTPSKLAKLISNCTKNFSISSFESGNTKTEQMLDDFVFEQYVKKSVDIAEDVEKSQRKHKIDLPIQINTRLAPIVIKWAEVPDELNYDNILWKSVIQELADKEIIFQEGDFLKVINSTIDVLKQIVEISPDTMLSVKASRAIDMLNKPPVSDILRQEIGEQE